MKRKMLRKRFHHLMAPLKKQAVPSTKTLSAILCFAMLYATANANDADLNYWHMKDNTITFNSDTVSARAEAPRGWVSLAIGEDEFLHTTDNIGGLLFRRGKTWITDWPIAENLAHNHNFGRLGSVLDGVFLLRITTGWSLPEFKVYAGFNDKRDHDMVMLLNDDIAVIRAQSSEQQGGLTLCQNNIMPSQVNEPINIDKELFLVHESGRALGVPGPVNVERVTLPNDEKHLALTFPCKGHAANSFKFIAYPTPRASRLLVFPKREVSVKNGTEALYTPDSEITYTLNLDWLAKKPLEGHVEIEFKHSLGKKTGYIKKEITEDMRTGSKYSIYLNPKPTVPGVQEIWARLIADNGEVLSSHRDRVIYDLQNFEPEYNTPEDMKQFWDNTLSEMRNLPLNAEVKRVYKDHPAWKLYDVSYDAWNGQRIHACMYIHKEAELPLPVKINTHPGTSGFGLKKKEDGIYGSDINTDKRFLTLIPLVRGNKPDAEDIGFSHPWWGEIVERDEYVARRWYCALVRSLDFLETQPDLADMSLIIARGSSQGGALALVTAALDDRVSACLTDCPSNSMLHYSVDPEYYKSYGPTAGQTPEGWTLQEFKDMLAYYDPANMAPWIKCPTVIGVSTGDLTVHSMGGLGIYKNLTSLEDDQKWFLPTTYFSHYHANSRRGGEKIKETIQKLLEQSDAE